MSCLVLKRSLCRREWGTKKPLVTYVERPFEGTKTEAYRALFAVEPTNVAVYLGKASGGFARLTSTRMRTWPRSSR